MQRLRILFSFVFACSLVAQGNELPGVAAFVNEATNTLRDDGKRVWSSSAAMRSCTAPSLARSGATVRSPSAQPASGWQSRRS